MKFITTINYVWKFVIIIEVIHHHHIFVLPSASSPCVSLLWVMKYLFFFLSAAFFDAYLRMIFRRGNRRWPTVCIIDCRDDTRKGCKIPPIERKKSKEIFCSSLFPSQEHTLFFHWKNVRVDLWRFWAVFWVHGESHCIRHTTPQYHISIKVLLHWFTISNLSIFSFTTKINKTLI